MLPPPVAVNGKLLALPTGNGLWNPLQFETRNSDPVLNFNQIYEAVGKCK